MITILIYISLILLLGYSALLVYYRKSWGSIPDFKVEANSKLSTKISIIIPARNEEENIGCCLQSIIEQSYPAHLFEVLVVDDHSTDNTAAIIKSYASQNVKLISLKDYLSANEINSYKKKAIEISIQQSNGELIVTSDADCIFPKNWLTSIASFYESKRPNISSSFKTKIHFKILFIVLLFIHISFYYTDIHLIDYHKIIKRNPF